jgi:hypothetical protein
MSRESRNDFTVIHSPSFLPGKILSQVPAFEGGSRSQILISCRIIIQVVYAKKKRIKGFPGKTQGLYVSDKFVVHPV